MRAPAVWLVILTLLPWGAQTSRAQRVDVGVPPSVGGIRFAADVWAEPALDGPAVVSVSYAVTYDELVFVRHGDGYRARFEVTAILYDSDGRQVAGDSWRRTVDVESYGETNSRQTVEDVLKLPAAPGRYRLKLELRSLDTPSTGVVEAMVEVPEMEAGKLTLGTIAFERERMPGEEGTGAVTHPGREYGEDVPTVQIRIPVYGDPGTRYELRLSVETSDGVVEKTRVDTVAQTAFLTENVRRFSVLDLEVGNYVVKVVATPLAGGDRVVRRAAFRVVTSPKSWGEDFEKMIAQISYVATRDEVERLLAAAPEDRDAAWEEFWRNRDPDPTTEVNEFKEEFLRRLGYANTTFRSVVEGWQTDMGRVYIQYGEPDDVESVPVGKRLNAWETWYYYDEHTKFIFVDKEGFGEYELVETSRI